MDESLAKCALSLEVGLANPYYRDEVLVLIETLRCRKVMYTRNLLVEFEGETWVTGTLRLASVVLGCERLLRHIISHYWGSDYFEEPLWTINSERLYRLVFSSANWERKVVGHPWTGEVDFGSSQSE